MPRKKALNKLIVEKFVKKETIIWPREMKMANDLIERYPDYDFWESIQFDFKLNSLAWFIGEGKDDLFLKWNVFKLELPKEKRYIIGNEKIGEDYRPSKKQNKRKWLGLW